MVVVVALAPFYRRIAADSAKCVYAAGAVENFARYVQAFEKLPTYIAPLLVGTGNGGSFVYALLAQAPPDSFTGVLSLVFCPRLSLEMPLCEGNALHMRDAGAGAVDLAPVPQLPAPWTVLQTDRQGPCASAAQSFVERVPNAIWLGQAPAATTAASAASAATAALAPDAQSAFDGAFTRLAARRAALDTAPQQLADLPIVEVPTTGSGARFAVFLSGDGGWASIDKRIAAALAKDGVPVAGLDSLRYFWSARTPEGVAADLDRVIRYYAARWKRSEVLLIGYSQGADVLPFAFNRLPEGSRARVRLTALLGPGQEAAFEFHVTNWIGRNGDRPIAPEARRMPGASTLCFYGADERADSLCPLLAGTGAQLIAMPGGHHLGGDYEALAARILAGLPR
jgi:type IV secretory pathway VirJ component